LDTKDVTSQAEVIRALREFAHAEVFKGWRKMLTGRRTATNTITLAGAPAGKTWVRAHDASREQTAVWGFVGIPNVTVYVAPGVDGDNRIMAIDYAESVQSHGSKVVLAQQPPLDGNLNTVIVAGRNILPGRARPYADSGSMLVYVEPFAHHEGRYAGGAIDLTSDIPATAGTCAWVAVALDPATGTLYSYAGTDSYDAPANLDEADAHAISIPDGYIPLAAAVLEEGMTEVTAATRIVDLRPHFYMRGGLIRDLDDLANVDTTGKADGDTLVWDAGASEWIAAATSVTADAADVTYTPADVTDWNSSTDPGDVDNALDQLADRVKTNEGDIAGLSGGGISSAGWVALAETLAYASADDPTYTATCTGVDLTSTLSVGMKLRVSQTTGGTKYFIITAIAFSSDTTLTLYGGTDYNLENEAISNPYFSVVKAPHGFPLDPTKWTVEVTDVTSRTRASPTVNVWYNVGSISISIPIGLWDVSYQVAPYVVFGAANTCLVWSTLSTANNSESDVDMTAVVYSTAVKEMATSVHRTKTISAAAKTTYYLNSRAGIAGAASLQNANNSSKLIIRARCAYL
jgi:hypothetical protein